MIRRELDIQYKKVHTLVSFDELELRVIGQAIQDRIIEDASKALSEKFCATYGAEIVQGINHELISKSLSDGITKRLLRKLMEDK